LPKTGQNLLGVGCESFTANRTRFWNKIRSAEHITRFSIFVPSPQQNPGYTTALDCVKTTRKQAEITIF